MSPLQSRAVEFRAVQFVEFSDRQNTDSRAVQAEAERDRFKSASLEKLSQTSRAGPASQKSEGPRKSELIQQEVLEGATF